MAQQPYNPSPTAFFDFRTDMDLSGNGLLWYARPQLFFRCTVCPTGSLQTPGKHKELALVFFSTFEPIVLTPGAVSSTILPAALTSPACTFAWLGTSESWAGCHSRVRENSLRTPTLPHSFGNSQGAVADSRNGAGNGSRPYEVTISSLDVALPQGSATPGYCRSGGAAAEGGHL